MNALMNRSCWSFSVPSPALLCWRGRSEARRRRWSEPGSVPPAAAPASAAGEKPAAENQAKNRTSPTRRSRTGRSPTSAAASPSGRSRSCTCCSRRSCSPCRSSRSSSRRSATRPGTRYDRLAHEFTKLLSVSFSLTATFGAFPTFMLIILYPKFTNYLMSVFSPTFLPYVILFFFEAFFLYTYYYGWGKFHPLVHLGLGLGLNLVGTAIMFIANAWLTFMMSPNGISSKGAVLSSGTRSTTTRGCRSTSSRDRERRVRRIGRRGVCGVQVPAPTPTRTAPITTGWDTSATSSRSARSSRSFAGYWLAKEIYAFSQTLGLTMMGGAFMALHHPGGPDREPLPRRQLLPLARMGRVEGRIRCRSSSSYLLIGIALCFMVWATPRSIIATVSEIRAMGVVVAPDPRLSRSHVRQEHAANILILTTFMSFLLYRRTGRSQRCRGRRRGMRRSSRSSPPSRYSSSSWASTGISSRGTVRIGLSVPQVLSVLFAMVAITAIDVFPSAARYDGEVRWGRIP